MNANINSITHWSYACAGLCYAALALNLALDWRGSSNGLSLLMAIAASAIWGAVGFSDGLALHQLQKASAQLADILRSTGWYAFFLAALAARLRGAGQSFRLAWLVSAALCVLVVGLGAQLMTALQYHSVGDAARLSLLDSLLMAVFGLLLVEQLLRGLPRESVRNASPLFLSVAGGFAIDIYLYAQALAYGRFNPEVLALRAVAHVLIVPLVAIGAMQSREWIFGEAGMRMETDAPLGPENGVEPVAGRAQDGAAAEAQADANAGLGAQVRLLVPLGNPAKQAQEVTSFKDVA
ncbi:MAG: hypothetical protein HGA47_03320 [Zoogloea sp.]|nr:hypothetical protein [Zoogloea sp.]